VNALFFFFFFHFLAVGRPFFFLVFANKSNILANDSRLVNAMFILQASKSSQESQSQVRQKIDHLLLVDFFF
jgi:hypothetical protein